MAKPTAFLATIPSLGTYLVFVAQPIPMHIHISAFDGDKPQEWGRFRMDARLAIHDSFETLCRCAITQAIESGLIGEGPHEFQDLQLDANLDPWQGELVPQA